jgi:outer membrane PBP1 activator LpoA protein
MSKLDRILAGCKASPNFAKVESQYMNTINEIARLRESGSTGPLSTERPMAYDTFLASSLSQYTAKPLRDSKADYITLKPFELISRIHKTVFETNNKGQNVVYEVSRPIHYRVDNEIKSIEYSTTPTVISPNSDIRTTLLQNYNAGLANFRREHPEVIENQILTEADIILINRRLLKDNVRCFRCSEREVRCFNYDWVTRQIL